jgi:tetratricopeptide (TPR) repeat protein
MKNQFWSVLAFLALGCAAGHQPPAAPVQPAEPAASAETPASAPELAAATSVEPGVPITSKSPQAIDEFKIGRDLLENFRMAEASEHLKRAILLDADFAQAHAYAALALPGSEGLAELEKAEQIAPSLPEAERLTVEAIVAERRGDEAKATELRKQLVQLAPNDWRAHWYMGIRASTERNWEEASNELKKAVELNPKAGSVYNQLGYAYLMQGNKVEAVASFKAYVETAPKEPNGHDSLGDALLAANHLEEAEAEYKKALEISPQFWFSWGGIAATRALRGDWKGAYDALASAAKAAPRTDDRLQAKSIVAWTQLAEGKNAEALETVKALEKESEAQKQAVSLAFGGLDRVALLIETGKTRDALKGLDEVTTRTQKDTMPGGRLVAWRQRAHVLRATAQEKLGKKDDVAKTLAGLEGEVSKQPATAEGQSSLEYVRGLGASAAGDAKGAAAHFERCIAEQPYCRWRLVVALEKAGDKAGADAAKQKIVDTPTRDPVYLYVRAKLGTIAKPAK